MEPKCYNCRNAIKGHPRWADHFIGCNHPAVKRGKEGMQTLRIDANEAAIDEGWFDFPFNFDPVWINDCKGFERV